MYFEIHKSKTNGQYWFVIKSAGNHQKLAISEMYTRKQNALSAIRVIADSRSARCIDKTIEE